MAQGSGTLTGELEAHGSWKTAATLRDLGHRTQIRKSKDCIGRSTDGKSPVPDFFP